MKDIGRMRDLVLEKVDMAEVMLASGVEFMYDPRAAQEVQYRCPFHGRDNKPSSRFYRETKSCWCWVCHKRWNVIDFVKDKDNLTYVGAILRLVDRWRLDLSSIPDAPNLDAPKVVPIQDEGLALSTLKERLRTLRIKIPWEKYAALCSAWYMLSFMRDSGTSIAAHLPKLSDKIEGLLV